MVTSHCSKGTEPYKLKRTLQSKRSVDYQVPFVTNLATVLEDSPGASAVGLGLANEVYVLLCLHTADPSSAVHLSHCLYNFVQAKQHQIQQGHTDPLNDYFNHQVDAIWRGLHKGRRTIVFPNLDIFRELACDSQGAAWRDGHAKAAQLQHFSSVATKIMTPPPARPQGPQRSQSTAQPWPQDISLKATEVPHCCQRKLQVFGNL